MTTQVVFGLVLFCGGLLAFLLIAVAAIVELRVRVADLTREVQAADRAAGVARTRLRELVLDQDPDPYRLEAWWSAPTVEHPGEAGAGS